MVLLYLLNISFICVFLLVYLIYYFLIYNSNSKSNLYLLNIRNLINLPTGELPYVSIIISAFEESKVIRRKLENTSKLNYPKEKMEVIVLDDASQDKTSDYATDSMDEYSLEGKVIRNVERIGLNASLNKAIERASHDIICITDTDVILDANSLRNSVLVVKHNEKVGGITGNIISQFDKNNRLTELEDNYRIMSNKAMIVESHLHSTFPGSGVLSVFKRSALGGPIPVDYGSTDGNISIQIIRNGYRFLYVPYANVYEGMPHELGEHKLQKIRRARRLIQVMIHNSDMLFNNKYGKFGTTIFPLKYLMQVICPLLIPLIILLTFYIILMLNSQIILLSFFIVCLSCVVVSLLSMRIGNLVFGFLLHQMYLIYAVLTSGKKTQFWKKIQR